MGPAIEGGVMVAEKTAEAVALATEKFGAVAAEGAETAAETVASTTETATEGVLNVAETGQEVIGEIEMPDIEMPELPEENVLSSENLRLQNEISADEQYLSEFDDSFLEMKEADPVTNRVDQFLTSREDPGQVIDTLRRYERNDLNVVVNEIESGDLNRMTNILRDEVELPPGAKDLKIYDTIDPYRVSQLEEILKDVPQEYSIDSIKEADARWSLKNTEVTQTPVSENIKAKDEIIPENSEWYKIDEKQELEAINRDKKEFELSPDSTPEELDEARDDYLRKEFATESGLSETSSWDDIFKEKSSFERRPETLPLTEAEKKYNTYDQHVQELITQKDTESLKRFMVSEEGHTYFGERFQQVADRKAMELVNEEVVKSGQQATFTKEQIDEAVAKNHAERLQTKPETKTLTQTKEKPTTTTKTQEQVKSNKIEEKQTEKDLVDEGQIEQRKQKYASSVVYNIEHGENLADVKIALIRSGDFWVLPEGAIDSNTNERSGAKKVIEDETGLETDIQTKISQDKKEVTDKQSGKIELEFQCFLAKSKTDALPNFNENNREVKWFNLREIVEEKVPVNKNSISEINKSIEIIKRREDLNAS